MSKKHPNGITLPKPRTVIITVNRDVVVLPPFIGLIHRHFEKSRVATTGDHARLTAPKDLLEFLVPVEVLDKIEEVELEYQK